jgi:protein DGCR14
MNNLMFPADANVKPYPKTRSSAIQAAEAARQAPKEINHANTRLPDEEDVGPLSSRVVSRRGSSPARSWVDAAVKGTPCEYIVLARRSS